MLISESFFWISFIFLFYTYIGYPLLIFISSRLFPRKIIKQEYLPSITFIIAAYNEEKVISQKLKETMELDYPLEKLEIIVASDGSTDRTEEIVSNFQAPNIRLIRSEERKGKTHVQNIAVEEAHGEILLFTDATTRLQKDSIRRMMRSFLDKSVGCVAGKLIFKDDQNGDERIGKHDKNILMAYEQKVRQFESIFRTTFGVDGCFYAIRKNLYKVMPLEVASDFALPLEIVASGSRVVFENQARCFEEPPKSRKYEFNRKIRTASRGIYSLFKIKKLLNPLRYGAVSLMLFSHKVLRWLSIYFLLALLISNIFSYGISLFYRSFLYLQILFYLLVFLGFIAKDNIKLKIVRIPFNFFMLNLSAFLGLISLLKGERKVIWDTKR